LTIEVFTSGGRSERRESGGIKQRVGTRCATRV
jgi:hypothetical protein